MRVLICTIFTLFAGLPVAAVCDAQDKQLAGWVEKAIISDGSGNIVMDAKLDTGALTTSIHSDNYQLFKKGHKEWVRFELVSHDGEFITMEEPVMRYSRIKRHFEKSQVRPVILLGICVGKIFHKTEVNIVDRGKFKYQLLVGRKFLEQGVIIDSSETFITSPVCHQNSAGVK